jgi:cytochrome bd-type quinol oxidase subunit 2
MNNFFQILLHFIFIATFLFVYIIAIIILKPFRLHRKRKMSTLALKLSYLVYLAFFLAFVYLVLFFADNELNSEETMENGTSAVYYVIVLVSFFIPNIGIMIRRRFKKNRSSYNMLVTAMNFLIILALVFLMSQVRWDF